MYQDSFERSQLPPERTNFGPPVGSVAHTIKSKMEGGNIFGGGENEKKDSIRLLYQEQLKKQLADKNAEKEAERQRKIAEDLRDEDRIKKDLEELNHQYAIEMKEDNKNKPPEPFDFQNIEKSNPVDNKSVYSKPPLR